MALGLLALGVTAAAPGGQSAQRLDPEAVLSARFGNDAAWYRVNIPLFASSDATLDSVYYYRWAVFRAHQRDLGTLGFITTEFLDDVGWQREPYASLNDASGFHIAEGRWLRDRRYAGDYIDFLHEQGGNDRHFSEAIADATYARFLVDGDLTAATRHLPVMRQTYALWDERFDFDRQLYWIEPLLDATEYTISSIDASGGIDGFRGGQAFRPSINAYMFANARAISRLSALSGDSATAADYAARAASLRDHLEASLWSPGLTHFIDRYQVGNDQVRAWDPIRGRELVGYLPWTFGLPADEARYAAAWKHLAPTELGGAFGLRTVEPSYRYYMRQYRYDKPTGLRECQWNGPVWPFQTTQVLLAMGNLIRDYRQHDVTRSEYIRLLRQYARLHFQGDRLDLEEDYDPATGKPIVGLARSHHYFHSGFDDLILGGVVGIRPREGDVLEVDPLAVDAPRDPVAMSWFIAQDVPYHGHLVTVVYDRGGTRFGGRAGLAVYVDGALAGSAATLSRIVVPVTRLAPPPIARPIDLAVELVRGQFPKPSASNDASAEMVHDAVDGRVMFFPESPNGWKTKAGSGEAWFAVDLGRAMPVAGAELAFFGDGKAFATPASYRLETWRDGAWRSVPADTSAPPLPNGVTGIPWPEREARRVRVVLQPQAGKQVRLVEFKLF
ncbi:discoidin domain-containing protein [Sphingosinicellaceae bacterium]|nr:discoidin domain-containing protein [Sphingosinicellaceae bacterium]